MYIFLILLSALFLGSYEVLQKTSLKRSSVYEVLFLYCLCGMLFSSIFILEAFSTSLINILLLLFKSCIIVINWILVMKAVEKLDVSITTPFGFLTSIIVVILSYFIYKEKITFFHIISMICIGFGIFFITLLYKKDQEKKKRKDYKAILYLVIATFLSACSSILDKYIINYRNVDTSAALFWLLFFNTIFYGIINFIKNKKITLKPLKYNYWIILTGLAIVLADLTYYGAINMNGSSISIISILRKLSVVVSTILASIFLKEKYLLKKILIFILMLTGVALPIIFK